jgi:hypothetical protein
MAWRAPLIKSMCLDDGAHSRLTRASFNSVNKLANYRQRAALTGTSVAPAVIQGRIIKPNPLGGS